MQCLNGKTRCERKVTEILNLLGPKATINNKFYWSAAKTWKFLPLNNLKFQRGERERKKERVELQGYVLSAPRDENLKLNGPKRVTWCGGDTGKNSFRREPKEKRISFSKHELNWKQKANFKRNANGSHRIYEEASLRLKGGGNGRRGEKEKSKEKKNRIGDGEDKTIAGN